jgi:hypothetical protein
MLGRVSFTAGGESRSLAFTTLAQVSWEEETGKPFSAVGDIFDEKNAKNVRVGDVLSLFRHALGGDVSKAAAAAVIDELGTTRAVELIGEALAAAYPDADKTATKDKAGAPGNGGKAKAGKTA